MTELNFEISVKEKAVSLYKKRSNQRKKYFKRGKRKNVHPKGKLLNV